MNEFVTSDFYLACFLRCTGYRIDDVRHQGKRVLFVFRDNPDRREAMMAFYNDEATVRPLAFVGAIKDMKALLHNR